MYTQTFSNENIMIYGICFKNNTGEKLKNKIIYEEGCLAGSVKRE